MDIAVKAPCRVSDRFKSVLLPFDPRVASLIPHARTATLGGLRAHIVRHGVPETRLLRNFGYDVPAPIRRHYNWPGEDQPFEAQMAGAELFTSHRRAYNLCDLGVGKTRAALFALDYLIQQGEVTSALVVAPLSTLTATWARELFAVFPHLTYVVVHAPTAKRRHELLAMPADVYIINHDGVNVLAEALTARPDINAVVLDELTEYKSPRTKRWKTANRVFGKRKYLWGLTGKPTPKDPTDAYGQVKLITPERVPKFFNAFRGMVMRQITQFKWVPLAEANNIVYEAMQPAVRFTRDQCVDLPPTTYSTLDVPMSAAQATAYKSMMDELIIQHAKGDIVAANAGVKVSKLLQIAGGFAYGVDNTGVKTAVDYECSARLTEVLNVVNASAGKVIVFSSFRYPIERIRTYLHKHGITTEAIHGGINKPQRDKTFYKFTNTANPQVLVAHPRAMSHGLTLTEASTILWYTPVPDLGVYEQANGRITRPGQKLHTHIIHLSSCKAEDKVYNTLQRRGSMQDALLTLFK